MTNHGERGRGCEAEGRGAGRADDSGRRADTFLLHLSISSICHHFNRAMH